MLGLVGLMQMMMWASVTAVLGLGIGLVCGLVALSGWNIGVVRFLYMVSDLCLGMIVQEETCRSAVIV